MSHGIPRSTLKAEFLTVGPDTRLLDEEAGTHQLLRAFVFYSAVLGHPIVVPKGFVTDYASVPRVVGAYLMFGGKGKRAAVVHDYLYTCGKYPRELCDAVFKEALQATTHPDKDGKPVAIYSAFTIEAMYLGVKLGGASHFTKPNVPQDPHVVTAMEFEAP